MKLGGSTQVAKGDWNSIRKLYRRRQPQQTRLRDQSGIVGTDLRAETFAEHLETVQWRVRLATLVPNALPPLFLHLPVNEQSFTESELRKAIMGLSSGKAARKGDVPIEVFKAMADTPGSMLTEFLDFCNKCFVS